MSDRRRPRSSPPSPDLTGASVPSVAVLDSWANADWSDGCQVDELGEMQPITVFTRNHLYEIFVIAGHEGRIRVKGGLFFPEWREATLAGCSLGGSFLKLRGLYTGFCMELHVDGEAIVTSPVQKLTLSRIDSALPN
jgi:hypothetical protein